MTPPTTFRADIHMALVIDSDSYSAIGSVMDRIAEAVHREIGELDARFDFTGFNTHPCKAAVMQQLAGPSEIDYAQPALNYR